MTTRIFVGDCLDVMPTLNENSADTIITDPPYGLSFMGKEWDHGVPGVPFWREALRVAKPGAMLLTFGGTRTHHRLMCAIEDAGWEIRDCLMWLYGSGFPKNHNISKAIDKAYISPDAQTWDGWGTALKPAWEPIILAMKPLDGTFAHNALEHGVAGLWVDGGRVEYTPGGRPSDSCWSKRARRGTKQGAQVYGKYADEGGTIADREHPTGRWPANLILSHAPGCVQVGVRKVKGSNFAGHAEGRKNSVLGVDHRPRPAAGYASLDGTETIPAWECVEGCPVAMLDAQSGTLTSGTAVGGLHRKSNKTANCYGQFVGQRTEGDVCYGDTGGASRFFYCAKASRAERNKGLEGMAPVEVNDGRQTPIDNAYQRGETLRRNSHPTVKPLALMRYLVKLTRTPTRGVVLDPFMGSGSTGVACVLEGRDFVGIEKDPISFDIARQRIEATEREPQQMAMFSEVEVR